MSIVEPRPQTVAPSADTTADPAVASLVRSLQAKTGMPPAVIERVVAEELVRFHEARVRTFIPILVERAARRLARPWASDDEGPPR